MTGTTLSGARPTPYDVLARRAPTEPATKADLVRRCRALERAALADPPDLAVVTLQDARHLSRRTLDAYTALARAGSTVVLAGRGLRAWLAPGVRGVDLADDDPLGDVWSVVLLGGGRPAAPVALAALDRFTPGGAEEERGFALAVTREPALVAACAAALDPVTGDVPRGGPGRAPSPRVSPPGAGGTTPP